MADDLREAEAIARGRAEFYGALTTPRLAAWLRPTVYILEGCDCARQAGRYHVHAFDPRGLTHWQAMHEDLRIVAAYPV